MDGEFLLHKREIPNIEDEINKIVELSDVGRAWTHVSSVENVNCYSQKSDRCPFDYVMGEGIVHTTTDILLQFLQNPNTTTEIDPTLIEREEIVKLSETSRVMRLRFKYPALLSNREFVVHAYDGVVSENPKTIVCASISVDHEMCQEDPQFVRGIMYLSAYVCKEITSNPARTHVAYVAQFDPKGWIPSVVTNMATAEQARNVLRLKKYFERATEQTYKFPPQLLKTVDQNNEENDTVDPNASIIKTSEASEAGEAGEANGSDSSQKPSSDWNESEVEWHKAEHVEWQKAGQEGEERNSIFNLLDTVLTGQDKEAKETLLDASAQPVTASKLLQNLFS